MKSFFVPITAFLHKLTALINGVLVANIMFYKAGMDADELIKALDTSLKAYAAEMAAKYGAEGPPSVPVTDRLTILPVSEDIMATTREAFASLPFIVRCMAAEDVKEIKILVGINKEIDAMFWGDALTINLTQDFDAKEPEQAALLETIIFHEFAGHLVDGMLALHKPEPKGRLSETEIFKDLRDADVQLQQTSCVPLDDRDEYCLTPADKIYAVPEVEASKHAMVTEHDIRRALWERFAVSIERKATGADDAKTFPNTSAFMDKVIGCLLLHGEVLRIPSFGQMPMRATQPPVQRPFFRRVHG